MESTGEAVTTVVKLYEEHNRQMVRVGGNQYGAGLIHAVLQTHVCVPGHTYLTPYIFPALRVILARKAKKRPHMIARVFEA